MEATSNIMEELFGIYADFFEVMSDVETGIMQLETVILNGRNIKQIST